MNDNDQPIMTYTVSGSLPFAWMTDEQIAAMSEDVGEMSAKVAAIIREAGAKFAEARAEENAP